MHPGWILPIREKTPYYSINTWYSQGYLYLINLNQMNIKNIIIYILFIGLSLLFYGCSCQKEAPAPTHNTKINQSNEEIVIYTQTVLKNDLENRLKSFTIDSISPIKITDNLDGQSYDIAIILNPKDDNKDIKTIYSYDINLSPEMIKDYFQDKVPNITIGSIINNDNQITQAISNYLKQSYKENSPQENKLIFTGCILPSRWVALRAQQHNDYTYPFKYTADITKNADMTISNLETPFAETGPYTELGMVFRGDPGLVAGLVFSGIDIVNLANNHLGDSQRAGMEYTFKLLDENNISYFGAGKNTKMSREPLIKEINGIKYAFLGYADTAFTPVSYESGEDYAGLNIMNEENLISDLENIKDKADFIIVSMHAGTEYTYNPNAKQISFAHTAIENGASMVYGHHPHVVQAIEYYKNKPIFYSPGNFSMDQLERNTQQGFIIELKTMFNQIVNINLIPYHIYDYSQPKPVEGEEADEIIDNVIGASKILNDEK